MTVNQDIKAIIPSSAVYYKYLAWALRASARDILKKCTKHGTTVHSIEVPTLKTWTIGVPPKKEQERIVAKIETLFSELDKGIESLKTAREQLKVYRQAVLKHAFEGKLTAHWREQNKDKLETPQQLLDRIQQERQARYQQQLQDWLVATEAWEENGKKGMKPGKPREPKPITDLSVEVKSGLPDAPAEWIWQKLGWMTCGVEYGTSAKSAESGTTPVIRMGNLQKGLIDWTDLAFTSDQAEIEKYELKQDDILFNRTNSPELVGKTSIYRAERPAVFAGYLIRINQINTAVLPKYLNFFLNSYIAKQHGNTVKTDGVNQSNINGEKLQSYPFPYCSTYEQDEIVRILEEKISLSDSTLAEIEKEILKSETLRQSILEKAFSGQLVPQDPNDEPASALLARIQAERDSQMAKPKTPLKRSPKASSKVTS